MGQRIRTHAIRHARICVIVLCLTILAGLAGTLQSRADETPAPREIRGWVLDRQAQPIAAATIHVLRQGLSMRHRDWNSETWVSPVVVRTAEDGSFVAPDLAGNKFHVRVTAPKHAPIALTHVPVGASLMIHLDDGHPVDGRVLDSDARPIAGALVTACDESGLDFGRTTCRVAETGEHGAFTLAHVPGGLLELRAVAAAYAVSDVARIQVPVKNDQLLLHLLPGARVAGRIVDAEEAPVAGARVWAAARSLTAGVLRAEPGWPDLSDENGMFVLEGVPAGTSYLFRAHRSDRAEGDTGPLEIEAGLDHDDLEIRLPAAAEIVVRLIDPDGTSVTQFDLFHREASENDDDYKEQLAPRWFRKDGEIVVMRIPRPETLDLLFVPNGYAEFERRHVALRSGRSTDLGTIELERGPSIDGRVTDRRGKPIPQATVEATWTGRTGNRVRQVRTGSDGEYEISGLGGSPVDIEARARGHVSESVAAVSPEDAPIDFELEPTGEILGIVELDDGSVPSAFEIRVHSEADSATESVGRAPREQGFSNEDGSYRIEDLVPGSYTIEARAKGFAPGRRRGVVLVVDLTTTVDTIVLQPGSRLRGRVVAQEIDRPVFGARVEAMFGSGKTGPDSGTLHDSTGTDAEGRFELNSLQQGPYTVRAEHGDFAPAVVEVLVGAEEATEDLVLRLTHGGTLTGTVLDGHGLPLIDSKILVVRNLIEMNDPRFAGTDPDGLYEIPRLAPGSYQVMHVHESNVETKTAVIREGEITVVDFGDEPRVRLSGTVLRSDEPVAGAGLFFTRAGRGIDPAALKHAETDGAGRYEIALDAPGSYRVMVAEPGSGRGGSSVELLIPDESEVYRDIVLGADGLAGTVLDDEGRPVVGATVSARRDGAALDDFAAMQVSETDTEGRYSIQGLQEGVYRVTAVAAGYRVEAIYPVEIGGQEQVSGVDLRLERGATANGTVVDDQGRGLSGVFVFAAPSGSASAMTATTTETDINGSFRITVPADGPFDVTAVGSGWAPARLTGISPDDVGDEGQSLILHATAGGSLVVQVTDADGSARSGVPLTVGAAPAFLGSDVALLIQPPPPTDAAGRSRIPHLAPGAYVVTIVGRPEVEPVLVVIGEGAESLARLEMP